MDDMMYTVESSSGRETPWTTEDVRKSCHHWSLAGDAALLNKLQDIAQNLVSMTHKVQLEVDTLVQDTSASHSKLGNVINDFLMLSNTQFVENRVYDDEVTDTTPSAKKKPSPNRTTEEQRDQIVAKVSVALRLGMSVIETAYEQLHVQNSDSEDEGETGGRYAHEPILRPKDPYRCRPLPCIIGSSAFLEDDHVGLVASVLSDEEHIEEDVKSVSSVEEETIPRISEVLPKDYSSEYEDNMNNGFLRSTERRDSEKSGDSDLFDPDKKDADNVSERSSSFSHREGGDIFPKTTDFQKELSSKLQPNNQRLTTSNASVEVGEIGDGPQSSKPGVRSSLMNSTVGGHERAPAQKKNLEASFGEDAGEGNDDDGLFAQKTGLFSVKGRLFDDSADEEDLFFEEKSSTSKKGGSKPKTDGRNNSFESNGSLPLKMSADSLFDDDGSNQFVVDAAAAKSLGTKKEAKTVDSLFDEINDDSIFEIIATPKSSTPTKKVLPGAVSMFGGSVDPVAMRKSVKQTSSKLESKVGVDQTAVSKKGLDNDDVGHPGSETSSRSSRSVSSAKYTKTTGGGGDVGRDSPDPSITSRNSTILFVEEPDVDDLFSTTEITKRKPIGGISLFDDEGDDDDIFAPEVKLDATKKKSKVNVEPQLSESANNFFDDIFAQIVKPRESSRKTSVTALFNDEMSTTTKQDANSDSVVTPISETVQEKRKPPRKVSLFDDDDGAPADDLFGTTQSSANKFGSSKVSSDGRGQSSLFDDDDSLLFGATRSSASSLLFNDDNLEVDLFEQSSGMKDEAKPVADTSEQDKKPVTSTPSEKMKKELVTASTSKSKVVVSDDDVEDDLFVKKNITKDALRKPSSLDNSGEAITLSPKLPSKGSPKPEARSSRDKKDGDPEKCAAVSLAKPEPASGDLIESPSRKKPPVGGVALFGGALTPVLKPKSSRDKSPVSRSECENTILVKPEIRPTSPFVSASPILPRVNATAKQAVDFEQPVKANPLHNANKDRIKIPVKRRPPTRRGRREAIRRSAIDMVVDDVDDSDPEISATVSAPTTPLTPDCQKVAEFTKKLPGRMEEVREKSADNERVEDPHPPVILKPDVKSVTASSERLPSSSAVGEKRVQNESSDSEGDGLFGFGGKRTNNDDHFDSLVTSTSTLNKSLFSDLDSNSNVGDDLFSSKSKPARNIKKSDSDDSLSLFGTSEPKSRASKLGRGKSLFDDDEDDDEDIFKSASTTKSSSTSVSKTSTRSSTTATDKKEFQDPLMANKKD